MTTRWMAAALVITMAAISACATGDRSQQAAGAGAEGPVYDVVIYGDTAAAVTAAVQSKRMGRSVVIVAPHERLGGMSSGGLGWSDTGNKAVIGGISREFYQRIYQHYESDDAWRWQTREDYGNVGQGTAAIDGDQKTMWIFEPHAAEQVFEDWIAEYDIPVHRDAWLDRENGVAMRDQRITAITTLDGHTFRGRMFIDATYEGDLMAAAGVSYTVGREGNDVYGETLNGVQKARAVSHQFEHRVSPYVEPGNPESGLLPRVHDGDPGEDGEGDHRVQAYNYRVSLTRVPDNRVPFEKPEGYDPQQYELLLRSLQAGSRHIFGKFDPIPNLKTDTNNHGPFSTDNIGYNYDYPEASYQRRREILEEHKRYQQGYFYFLANDERVPDEVRERYAEWGLAKDEFEETDHWPHQIYVREGRRMVSDFVVTELHLRRTEPTPRSVGMGSYNMDSHNTQRYIAYDDETGEAYVRNEGDIQINPGGPYPVDYGAIVPRQRECENLLVPVAVSASHIAFGSIRMEPVFMILGQSAATAASLALDDDIPVQAVAYDTLRERLLDDGQVLEYEGDGQSLIRLRDLQGVVMEASDAQLSGTWVSSSTVGPAVFPGYRHDDNADKGDKHARFALDLPEPGEYELRIAYSAHGNRATNVPVTVHHEDGETTIEVNQQEQPPIDRLWRPLGTFRFGETAEILISNAGTDGYVIIDAVQLLPAE